MVTLHDDLEEKDEQMLRRLVENHVAYTGSERGQLLLENWERALDCFVKVMPEAYRAAISEQGSDDVRSELPDVPGTEAEAESAGYAASDD